MNLCEEQKARYADKYKNLRKTLERSNIKTTQKMLGYKPEDIKKDIMSNSDELNKFAFKFANLIQKGGISCTTFAAVIAALCDEYDISYKVMVGFCLDKTKSNYESDMKAFKSSDNKPIMYNHVYVKLEDGTILEYFKGIENDNIDHLSEEELI